MNSGDVSIRELPPGTAIQPHLGLEGAVVGPDLCVCLTAQCGTLDSCRQRERGVGGRREKGRGDREKERGEDREGERGQRKREGGGGAERERRGDTERGGKGEGGGEEKREG